MSSRQIKTWLVGYDIREPRRLRRVHRLLRKRGLAAQYSAFTVEADDVRIIEILRELQALIDARVDDVRAYHVPADCRVWRLGKQHWPEGVILSPASAARLLLDTSVADASEATNAAAHQV